MNNRSIRIFLSSTFRDFGEERDLLVKRVFPALRARLKDRFVELVDVDLRWGITVEEAERGEVLPICLAEIDRSRPYFIGMLGERYGWIPPHEGFAPDLLEREPWLKKHQGGKSVTELEILHGVLKKKRMKSRAFFYFRSPAYARYKGGHYVPETTEDRQRQLDLKRRIKDSGYSVKGYRHPEALAKRMERDLWALLDAEFPATEVPDAFERESMRYEAYAAPRRRLYLGGERYQTALGQALDSGEQRIVIEGASGCGKSALIANFFEGYRKRHPKHYIHEHYLGASADAGDPHALVRRLCEFIKRKTGSSEDILGDQQKLMDSLPLWLAVASAWARKRRTKFIFVLDALNSLSDQQDLRWWPAFLPQGVSFVVSCLPGSVLQTLKLKGESLEGQKSRWKGIPVKPLTNTEQKSLLRTYLARFNKTLPKDLTAQVMSHPLSGNPLFIRILAEELRLFGVHEELTKRLRHYLISKTINELFEKVIERAEGDCGKKAVKDSLTAIWASRVGLTEKEILGIANLKPAEWAPIRNALDEALCEANGKFTFTHDYARLGARSRYIPTDPLQRKAHRGLAQWFACSDNLERKVQEEPYQLMRASAWAELQLCLTSWDTFAQVCKGTLTHTELLGYWNNLRSHRRINLSDSYRKALGTHKKWRKQTAEVAEILNELGTFLHLASAHDGLSEHVVQRALSIRRRIFGQKHPRTFDVESNLLMILSSSGKISRADRLINRLMRLHGPRRPSRLPTLKQCELLLASGSVSHDARRFDKSESAFTQAAAGYRAHRGPGHEDTLIALSNQVGAMLTNDRREQGAVLLDDLCRLVPQRLGAKAPLALVNNFNRAKLLHDRQLWAQAERRIREVLEDDLTLFGPYSLEVARDLELLGSVQCGRHRYVEGLRSYAKAQNTLVRIHGNIHPRLAQLLGNIANAYFQMQEFLKAQKLLRQSCEIAQALAPRGSCDLAMYLKELGFAHFMVSNADPIVGRLFERSLALYKEHAGCYDERTIDMLDTLGNWLIGKSETLVHGSKRDTILANGRRLLIEAQRYAGPIAGDKAKKS
jgi:hypothetical protein